MAKGKVTAKKSAKKPANKPAKKTAPKAAAQSGKKTAKKAASKPAKASAKKTSGAKASSSKAKSSVKTSAKASSKSTAKSAKPSSAKAAASKSSKTSTAKKPVLKGPLMSKPPTFSSGKKADAVKVAPKSAKSTEKLDLSDFITPLDDRVIIQPQERETMTAGGLYIPDSATNESSNLEGWVVSVGRGHLSPKGHVRPMDVKVGDRVLFPKHAGSQFKVQNHDLLILRESDVLGVVG